MHRIAVILLVILGVAAAGMGGYVMGLRSAVVTPVDAPASPQDTDAAHEIAAEPPAETPVSRKETIATERSEPKVLTCADRMMPVDPPAYSSNPDSPTNYLDAFLKALPKAYADAGARETIKCYLDDPDVYKPGGKIDPEKNLSDFLFRVGTMYPSGRVEIRVSDPEFTERTFDLYTRKKIGGWRILDISDDSGVLTQAVPES